MKTVLITGGFGYVGSRLTPHLLGLGYRVKVLDLFLYGEYGLEALRRNSHFPEWRERCTVLKNDIRDLQSVNEAMQGVDMVVHLAAISNDPTGEVDEVLTREVNFDAVGLLLSSARKHGVKRFINASSSSVFGKRSESQITEELEPEPLTYYSKYKMLSEWLVVAAAAPDFVTVNIRPATICGYSPRQRFDLTVNKLTADAIRKGVITVNGGQQRRPNIGMTDMIRLYGQLLEADARAINGQTFNFGFENLRIIDIAHLIRQELSDLPIEIRVTEVLDQRDYHISSKKIETRLGYVPVSSIKQEVQELRTHLLLQGEFENIDAPQHYNMKSMKISRNASAYDVMGGKL